MAHCDLVQRHAVSGPFGLLVCNQAAPHPPRSAQLCEYPPFEEASNSCSRLLMLDSNCHQSCDASACSSKRTELPSHAGLRAPYFCHSHSTNQARLGHIQSRSRACCAATNAGTPRSRSFIFNKNPSSNPFKLNAERICLQRCAVKMVVAASNFLSSCSTLLEFRRVSSLSWLPEVRRKHDRPEAIFRHP